MLKDFDVLKVQLLELADVVNKFKSEAVQLRLVELVFASATGPGDVQLADPPPPPPRRKGRRAVARRAAGVHSPNATGGTTSPPLSSGSTSKPEKASGKKASTGDGAVAMLSRVYTEGFFSSPRSISDIVEHIGTNLAKRIRANEISGKLARMVRSGELKRAKNANGQFEYIKE